MSDHDRAWCRSCGLDLRPEEAKREYPIANSELERVQAKFPEMFS